MNNLQIFEGNEVEVFEFEGKVLFNPRDVGKCLELSKDARIKCVQRMSSSQVIKLSNEDISGTTNCPPRKLNNFGENFITESGVYKMIFASRCEGALKFQDWVTDEVLPSIRKHGKYEAQNKMIEDLNSTVLDMQGTINEYKKLCKINCSKKSKFIKYIKYRLGIVKADKEFDDVKARLFLILDVEKWEEIEFDNSDRILHIIDESIRVIKSERPYQQLSFS